MDGRPASPAGARATTIVALVALVATLAAVPLAAQRLPFTVYTTDDGLPATQVWSILEDRRGLLWIATSWGLARFDGQTFSTLSVTEGLPSANIRSLLEDREGVLWIGTNSGLARYDGRRVVAEKGEPELEAAVWSMALDRARPGLDRHRERPVRGGR